MSSNDLPDFITFLSEEKSNPPTREKAKAVWQECINTLDKLVGHREKQERFLSLNLGDDTPVSTERRSSAAAFPADHAYNLFQRLEALDRPWYKRYSRRVVRLASGAGIGAVLGWLANNFDLSWIGFGVAVLIGYLVQGYVSEGGSIVGAAVLGLMVTALMELPEGKPERRKTLGDSSKQVGGEGEADSESEVNNENDNDTVPPTAGPHADLEEVSLEGSLLQGPPTRAGMDLRGADLRGARLQGAYLRRANLEGANLEEADLLGSYVEGAYLRGARLQGADLRGAHLQGAHLRRADLRRADLQGADLLLADLRGADLRGAELEGAMHLTQKQLEQAAIGDELTTIPRDLAKPAAWFGSSGDRVYSRE